MSEEIHISIHRDIEYLVEVKICIEAFYIYQQQDSWVGEDT